MIINAYFMTDDIGVDLPETVGIILLVESGKRWHVPHDITNSDWQMYLDWKAEDPENNTPQTEP